MRYWIHAPSSVRAHTGSTPNGCAGRYSFPAGGSVDRLVRGGTVDPILRPRLLRSRLSRRDSCTNSRRVPSGSTTTHPRWWAMRSTSARRAASSINLAPATRSTNSAPRSPRSGNTPSARRKYAAAPRWMPPGTSTSPSRKGDSSTRPTRESSGSTRSILTGHYAGPSRFGACCPISA